MVCIVGVIYALLVIWTFTPTKEVSQPSTSDLPPTTQSTTLPATTSVAPSTAIERPKTAELVPDLSCKLEYPYKLEKAGVVKKQISNPRLIITNTGAIKVVAFSVDYKSYLYDVPNATIASYGELAKNTTGHLIFVKELAPSEEIKQDLNGFNWKSYAVGVYIFELKFYRESDMKLFTHKYIYFIDNYNIFLEKDYSKNANYAIILKAIKNYKPSNKAAIVRLDAVADHVWLSKETPQNGIHLLSADGKSMSVVSIIPDDPRTLIQQTYSSENRPVLYIKPSQFKSTGTYISPKIVDNITVTTEISYEVENIGNEDAANVREMGGQPYGKLLKPGEKIYLRKQIEFKKGGDDKHSSEDFIKEMDKQDYSLGASDTVLYSDKSKNKEYIARFIHGIGRNKFQLIMYQAN